MRQVNNRRKLPAARMVRDHSENIFGTSTFPGDFVKKNAYSTTASRLAGIVVAIIFCAVTVRAQATATFVNTDTTTQGSWMGVYGADAYDIAGGPQSPANGTLSYGSYALHNQAEWTYASSTTDQRALQIDMQGDRMASAWYNTTTFTLDVNLTDGNTHQIALYLLDWDHQGRGETVTVTNYSSGATLDTRNIPNSNTNTTTTNFQNGTYLLWSVSGHVTFSITNNAGPNAVLSGIFFGGSPSPTAPSITSTNNATFTVGQNGSFTVTATSSPTSALSESGTLPTGVNFVDNHNGTGTLSGIPTTNAGSPYQISFTANNGVMPNSVQLFTLTVNPQVVSSGPSATFLSADTTSQGNWMSTYGADGYDIAGGPQSPANSTLSYGSYSVQNEAEWTYASSTTDTRALETDSSGDRVAAVWYGGSFNFDVNFTDSNTHQVALYLYDWDHQGRVENITVTSYSSGAMLDARTIPNSDTNTTSTNFGNGTYLLWNISGHVTITITGTAGPNAAAAGIFFGGSPSPTAPSITSANNIAFTIGQPGTFTVTTSGSPTPSLSETGSLPSGVTFVDNHNGTGTLSGTPAANSSSSYGISFTATNTVTNANQSFTLTINPAVVSSGPSATFLSADTTSQGNWMSTYGADGYDIAGGPQSPANGTLSYGSYSLQNEAEWTYSSSTTDTRALEIDSSGDRVAAVWYGGSFSFNLSFTDSNTHQVALYLYDWDHQGRVENISITNTSSGATLDTRTIPNSNTNTTSTNLGNGTYLLWNISGQVTITITGTAGPNATVAGIFFGGSPSPTAPSITSANNIAFTIGQPGTFTVTTSGSPTPSLSENGSLPSGVTFVDNHNGTGTLSGTPTGNSNSSYSISFTATNTVTSANQSFTLNVNPNPGGAVATFLTLDTTTQGNWIGNYGIDGYALTDSSQSLPSYAQNFTVENEQTYLYASNPSGTSALEVPGGGSIAAAWYSQHDALPPAFSFAVNFSDGKTHMLALYALDWDQQGRAEMIQIYDANSNALLDTRYLSNFENGVYALWNISGSVIINVTQTVGPNSVISGVFFGGSAASAVNVALPLATINLPPGQSQQFTSNVTGTTNTAVTWAAAPSGIGTLNSAIGFYTAPSSAGQTVTITATSAANSQKQAVAKVNITTGGVANFLATDTGTEGSYQGVYGADYSTMIGSAGNVVTNGSLSYGTFKVLNGQPYVWNGSTTDPRALNGVASSWNNPEFSVNITDGKLHQLALYALDWDSQGRAETIQITDTVSGAVLDTRTISNFSNGIYLIWNVSGNITINVTLTSGPNPVMSGVFLGGAAQTTMIVSPPSINLSAGQSQQFSANVNGGNGNVTWTIESVNPPGAASGSFSTTTPGLYIAPSAVIAPTTVVISATSNGLTGTATVILVAHATASSPATFDTTTQGSWQGRYGSQGWSVAGATDSIPSFATFSVSNNTNGVQYFAIGSNDPRALETGNGGTIAAAWSKNHESFSLNVDFTDNKVHQFAIYACDYDNQGRTESIQILDAVTGAILDSEILSNFENGVYLIWNISGNVTINVTNDGNTNPNDLSSGIVSGVFFQ